MDRGGLERFPDVMAGRGRAGPGQGGGAGGAGPGGGSRDKFWGEGMMGSNDGMPGTIASRHPGLCRTPTRLPPRLRRPHLPRTTTMTTMDWF
jgi:hypothetical protein